MLNIQEELKNSLKLLQLEWKEDLEQYKKKFLYTSISDKKEQGVCWYPLQIKKSKIDKFYISMVSFPSNVFSIFIKFLKPA